MTSRLLVLCPGQGSQHAGMLDLARSDARAAEFLAHFAPASTECDMFENRVAQPLIVAATLAMWEALRDRVPMPALAAGYSIGELAAYGIAGALAPQAAIGLAAKRADCMDRASALNPGQAMLAVTGLAVERAHALADQAGASVAIVTGEDACIAGGTRSTLESLARSAAAQGARCQELQVAVASHTPLMAAAVAPFAEALAAAAWQTPSFPVLSGIDATRIAEPAQAIDHLSRQLAQTILWSSCMDAAVESGVTVVLELGPGASLSRMFRTRYPELPCRSVSEFRSIDGIAAWLERQAD
jgi:[acyl-carrier-protein] S-malonyltransferase